MLTTQEATALITETIFSIHQTLGHHHRFKPEEFEVKIDKPGIDGVCSFYIYTVKRSENLRVKLYVTRFSDYTVIGALKLLTEQNFSEGERHDLYITDCTLDINVFSKFFNYSKSKDFKDTVITATDYIMLEDGSGYLKLQMHVGKILQET
jgi:hypothetical protein